MCSLERVRTKSPNTKTIEVSTATYDKIHSVKSDIAKIDSAGKQR